MDENKQKEAIQSQIESAMQQGASLNAIIDHLSSSEDVLHQQYAKRLRGEEVQDESYRMRPPPTQEITTPLLNTSSGAATSFSNLPVEQQIGYGLAGVAGLGGLGLATYAGKEYLRNKISATNPEFKRQNDIAERNILLKEKELEQFKSPIDIEQARVDVEKAKAERIREATRREQELHQQKIIQMGRSNAKQTITPTIDPMMSPEIQQSTGLAGLNQLEQQTGGPITTGTDLKMIQQSEQNRLAKEAEAKAAGASKCGCDVFPFDGFLRIRTTNNIFV